MRSSFRPWQALLLCLVLLTLFAPFPPASDGRTGKLGQVRIKERATLRGHKAAVASVAFSPDGKALASGSVDGTIKLWEVATGQERATLQGHRDVLSFVFSPARGKERRAGK